MFFKITGKTCGKICICLPRLHIKKYLMIFIRFFFSDFLYKSICCEYSFELHRQVDAIQMGTHNIWLYKEVNKIALAVIGRLRNCLTVHIWGGGGGQIISL